MKRIYDDECKKALERFFKNCAKAVRNNVIADPGSMGEVAWLMRRFVVWTEGMNGQDEASSLEWFDFTARYAGYPPEMSDLLWRKTGVGSVIINQFAAKHPANHDDHDGDDQVGDDQVGDDNTNDHPAGDQQDATQESPS